MCVCVSECVCVCHCLLAVTSGGRPVIPYSVPTDVASIIAACWSQRAEDRPSFDTVLAQLNAVITQLKAQANTQGSARLSDISVTLTTTGAW